MFPILLATFTTFGPIAQDASSLYVNERGSIVRVDKDDPSKRTTLTDPTPRRIAAVDVDGDRVFYATAPAPVCTAALTFPPQTLYVHYLCSLNDDKADHEIHSVSIFGGDDKLVLRMPTGSTEIAHDDDWIYWLSPSNAIVPASASLSRKNKTSGSYELIAAGLVVSAINQHPFALADDAIYVISNDRLLRVAKSGGAVADVAAVNPDSSIAIVDGVAYFVRDARIFALDTHTGAVEQRPVPIPSTSGATFPIDVLGAAPGLVLTSEGAGWMNALWHGWSVGDLCSGTATLLGSVTADVFHGYFIAPLTDPAIAVDSAGIYIGGRRVQTFANPSAPCRRHVAAR